MRKNKILTKTLSLSVLSVAVTSMLANVSCSDKNSLFFTVTGKDLEVTFCDKGASIYSIKYKNEFITYQPQDKNIFLQDDNYYGKTLGRVAGRIKDGNLTVGGHDYKLEVNEIKDEGLTKKNNCLHGGTHSLATVNFEHQIQETNDAYDVSFHYISPHLESGFPEELDTKFVYTLYKNESKIDLNITATSSGLTPVNLSTHPFFRLASSGDIKGHELEMPGAKYVAIYDNMQEGQTGGQIVVGKEKVDGYQGGIFNFTVAKKIGQDIGCAKDFDPVSGGYDHIWVFDSTNDENNKIILSNDDTKLKLTVESDADAVIMYANCFPNEGQKMNDGEFDTENAAITIEPYKFFTKDTVSDLNINKDQTFSRFISYKIDSIS